MGPANRHQHLTAGKRPNPFLSRRQPHLPVHAQRHQKKGLSSLPRAASWLIVILIFISLLSVIEPESLLVPKILSIEHLSSAVSTTTTGIHWPWDPKRSEECRPPSANLFSRSPPRPTHTEVVKSMAAIDKYLSDRASKADIDSISVALVTPAGTLWQGGYGVLRANETGDAEKGTVDGDSIYRIASISKAFTVLETLILRERGALSWDDPIERYIPQLTIPPESYGWANHLDGLESDNHKTRVTLKDLASHLGGIGRDYPPVDIGEWPFPEEQAPRSAAPSVLPSARRFNPLTGEYEPHELPDILRAVSEYPLVNHPQTYPIYSNTGIDLLGLANIRANALHSSSSSSDDPAEQPTTHRDLLRRDIFAPLQMNSTFFRLPTSNHLRQHIAVPSSTETSVWADISLGDADDPAGGQYSSLSDLARFMKTLLDPLGRGGIVPARVVREWLRPVYVWGETSKQVGLPWEIMELSGVTAYTKGGNLPGYHSEFAVFPEYSLGIILLVTGDYDDTTTILGEVSKRALPTFSNLHNAELKRRYGGTWTNGEDVAEIALDEGKGAIHLSKLVVRGIDVVQRAYDLWNRGASKGKPKNRIFLWPTGRLGEFRLAFGRPQLNDVKDVGCTPYWLSLDPGFNSRGAPLDLVYWKAGMLYYPSAGVRFGRQK